MIESVPSEKLFEFTGPYYSMVKVHLKQLDGSSKSAIVLMTGIDPDEYGGIPSLDSATKPDVDLLA
jgi:hypothetical protein